MASLLDALGSNIAVADANGTLLHANAGWLECARTATCPGAVGTVGTNYPALCEAADGPSAWGREVADAVRAVVTGRLPSFANEYECAGDADIRWFRIRVMRFDYEGAVCALIAHDEITSEKRAQTRLAAQYAITRVLAESADLADATLAILRVLGEELGCDIGLFWECDRASDQIRCVGVWKAELLDRSAFEGESYAMAFRRGVGFPGRVWEAGAPVLIADLDASDDFLRTTVSGDARLRSGFGFPVLLDGDVLGVMEFFSRHRRQPDADMLQMLSVAGSQIGQFIERGRAEQTLSENEAQFGTIFNQAAVGIGQLDLDGRFMLVNERFCEILGRRRDELLSLRVQDVMHPEASAQLLEALGRLASGGPGFTIETRYLRPDGSTVWADNEVSAVCGLGPALRHLVIVAQDITERKQADLAARRLVTMVDNSHDFLALAELDGSATLVNRAGLTLAELDGPDAVATTRILDYVFPEDRAFVEHTLIPTVLETGRWVGEMALRGFKTGARIPMSWDVFRVDDPLTGRPINIGTVARNVTERKRAEALLAGEKQVLELAARGAPLHETLTTFAGLVEELSGAEFLSSILLLDDEGLRLRHGAAPNLPPDYCAALDGTAIGPEVGSCGTAAFRKQRVIVEDIATDPLWADYRELALSHGLRACWSTPIFSSGGRVLGTFAMYYRRPRSPSDQDLQLVDMMTRTASLVIERHRVDEERAALLASLRESEAHFRTFAEAAPQMVWGAGANGFLDYYNRVVYDYTGATAEDLQREGWSSLLHPDERESVERRWRHSIETGEDYEAEFRVRSASGDYRWFLARALPVPDHAGRATRWCGTCTDVDDKKRAEERLFEADRRKDEFLATLAHELRNPLAPIRNSLQILSLRRDDPAAVEQMRGVIERQVRQIVRLVDDLLDLSRITRGKVKLQKVSVDLAEVVAVAVETSRPLVESRQHQLRIQVAEPLVIEADPARLAQVLANLLINAAKYTEVGGTIWLEATQAGGEVVVRVRDTGVGISPEMLPRVFDMFAQEENSFERSQGGLGLGLPLVRQLVEMHGGAVEARSPGPGRGCEFVVRLPVRIELLAQEPTPSKANFPLRKAPSRRILVVDDNIDSADSLALLLGLDGHVVEAVHDGLAAVERAQRFGPEIVFLDLRLPKLDGYGVVERLRAQPGLENTVFVATTGYGDEEARRRTAAAGFHHHLVKPMDLDALAALLASEPGPPAAK